MEDSKPFVPHSHIPYGKVGSETFSDRNVSIHEVSHAAVPLVLETVHSMVIDSRSVFTIVDYGTADGGTSMPVIYACVKVIREKYGNELPIIVIYEDQPVNNFTSVFLRIQGLIPGPRSFLQDFPNVFVMASGTNFYSQCFPNSTVALGLSSISVHWLSKKPCNITGAIHHLMASVPEEEEKFRKQAEKDWETFLMKRAAELMPGARMVLSQSVVDEHGQYPGNTNNIKVNCSALLNNLWKALLGDGVITQDEFTNTNFNFYLRTIDEFKKPFECNDSPVVKAGLELGSIETKILHCPYKEKWFKEKHKVKEHAINYVEGIRTWSNSSFLSGLSESRSDEEKIKIVDELFHRLEDEVVNHPEDHGIEFVCCYFVIKKRQL